MEEKTYKLEKDIPVLDWKTKKFVRNLETGDLDGLLLWEIEHENVSEIWINDNKTILYTTKEDSGLSIVNPGNPFILGFVGCFEIQPELLSKVKGNLEHYAALMGISLFCRRIESLGIYQNFTRNSLWEITVEEKADISVKVFSSGIDETFHFRRIWPKEREERGLPFSRIF